jgi:uncharacterized protein (DUF302 family)
MAYESRPLRERVNTNEEEMMQNTTSSYGFGTALPLPIEQAIERTREALKAEGFGVLSTIDVRQTMKEKLEVEFEPYVILGACNPQLAHRALQAEHDLGLLLPCNVIVHEHDGTSVVSIVDPAQMLGVVGNNAELDAVAREAGDRLRRVVRSLEGAGGTE